MVDAGEAPTRCKQVLERVQYDNVKVYHCTILMHGKGVIFDGDLLQPGLANWSTPGLGGSNFEYTLVLSRPIVQAFVEQIEEIFKEACKPLESHEGIFYRTTAQFLEKHNSQHRWNGM